MEFGGKKSWQNYQESSSTARSCLTPGHDEARFLPVFESLAGTSLRLGVFSIYFFSFLYLVIFFILAFVFWRPSGE